MTRKSILKQALLSTLAAVLILGGVFGLVWQIFKFKFEPPRFGDFNVKLFLAFIVATITGGKLIKATQNVVPTKLNEMTGEQFENYVASLLRSQGHTVKMTSRSGDYGVDIIVDGCVAIQCKRYSKSVGVKAVQEVYAGMQHYGCTSAIVVTNSHFTKNAAKLADELHVSLRDGSQLMRMM